VAAVAILAQRRLRVPLRDRLAVRRVEVREDVVGLGAPSRFPLKWQWVQVTRLGCSRCGISLTSKWQSVHPFFPCTDPASMSPVTKRSRTRPSTSSLRNSGFPWHRVHFSSEIEAEASRASPGRNAPPRKTRTAVSANFLIKALPFKFFVFQRMLLAQPLADTFR